MWRTKERNCHQFCAYCTLCVCLSVCQITGFSHQDSSLQSAARPVRSALTETEHQALLSAVISTSNFTIFDLITLVTFCVKWRSLLLTVAADCLSKYCRRLMRVVMTLTLGVGVPCLQANQLQKTYSFWQKRNRWLPFNLQPARFTHSCY